MTFDIGENLFGLGIFFLLLKYILPLLVGLALLILGYAYLRNLYNRYNDPLNPTSSNWLIVAVCVVLIVILIGVVG